MFLRVADLKATLKAAIKETVIAAPYTAAYTAAGAAKANNSQKFYGVYLNLAKIKRIILFIRNIILLSGESPIKELI